MSADVTKVVLHYSFGKVIEPSVAWIFVYAWKFIIDFKLDLSLDNILINLYSVLDGVRFFYEDPWGDTLEIELNGSEIRIETVDSTSRRPFRGVMSSNEYLQFVMGIYQLNLNPIQKVRITSKSTYISLQKI